MIPGVHPVSPGHNVPTSSAPSEVPGLPSVDALRILFLDSWKPAAHDGSGTAVGISLLARALRAQGNRVEVLRPIRGAGTPMGRLAFNLGLPRRLDALPTPDLIVGFDVDGFRWGASSRRHSPYFVALKGVAVDEARFARSPAEHRFLRTLGFLERRNAAAAERVLVPSAYSARVVQAAYGIPADRLRVVPEPIVMAEWDALRKSRMRPPAVPTILSVARQYPRKDTATLLRAMPAVLDILPQTRLLVVGGGPELPALRALTGELGIGSAVRFLGSVHADEEVRHLYMQADVFCLPSLQEGFGIVFLEAMAAGLPVVAAAAGAVPEVVAHGETGLLVPPADPVALAEALVDLLADGDRRARMGEAGVLRARRHDLAPVAHTFLDAVGHARGPTPNAAHPMTPSGP